MTCQRMALGRRAALDKAKTSDRAERQEGAPAIQPVLILSRTALPPLRGRTT